MNFLETVLSAEFIRAFAWTLFHSVWQGGLLAMVAGVFMIILRKHRPGIRYAMLYFCLLLLPVFFAGTFLMTFNPGNVKDAADAEAASMLWRPDHDIRSDMPAVYPADTPQVWYDQPVRLFENQAKWLVMIWFAGFLIFLIRFSGSMLYVYRLKNIQVFQVDEQWMTNLRRLSGRIGLYQPVRLVESALARIPMTIGYLKPVILLPLGTLSGVPPQQIDAILLHELAHIMRKDYLLNIIQSVIELMFFYHPVTWWLSGMIRQEREHVCDDLVISIQHDHINYIKALTTMEELNSKTPLLANALAGSKKNLLLRVKRLIYPVRPRKSLGEGIIALILLIGLIFTLSFNALSVIPSTYDLTGGESGERIFNLLPFKPGVLTEAVLESSTVQPALVKPVNAEIPDTIISTSKSGKVVVKVITDSTDNMEDRDIKVFVERLDRNVGEWERARNDYEKNVIIMKKNMDQLDSIRKVVIIKSGDSIKVIQGDSIFWLPGGYETSIVTDSGFQFYGFDIPEFPEIPEMPEMPDFRYHYDHDRLKNIDNYEKALREYEFQMRDVERDQQLLQKELGDVRLFVPHPDAHQPGFHENPPVPPDPSMREFFYEHGPVSAEMIIRQELIDDGLAIPHKKYVIDLDSRAMYMNGEKQPKEVFRKYKRLVESLDVAVLEGDRTYRLIF